MDLSQKITELADQYDPAREADAAMSRSLLQGAMVGGFMRALDEGIYGNAVKVSDVELGVDERGDYEDHFFVVTGAGHRIKVSVEVQ